MKYTVEWLPAAENDLAIIWIQAPNRAVVTAIADLIDDVLRRDPLTVSEAHGGLTRVLIEFPLAVAFDVQYPLRHVIAWGVWYHP